MHSLNTVARWPLLAGLLLAFTLQGLAVPAAFESEKRSCGNSPVAQRFNRTELFLGLSRRDGSTITDTEFQRFVEAEIAPRFPDGFTVVPANGQFKDVRGVVVRENARVLVVLHRPDGGRASTNLESIRAAYKARYQQDSVLRVDGEACASF